MKKGLLAFALSCVLLVPGATAFAAEVDDGRAEAVEAATNLLAAFQLEGCPFEEFGFEPFDVESAALGESFACEADESVLVWPILDEGTVVAVVVEVQDEGGSSYSLSADVEDFLQGSETSQIPSLSNEGFDGATSSLGVVSALSRSSSSVLLPISVVMQGKTENCWAAVVSTIARYLTGEYKSPGDIALDITGSIQSGGSPEDVQRAFSSYVYPETGTSIVTQHLVNALSDTKIKTYLDSKMPIYARFTNGATRGHAITVYGYTVSPSGSMTISIMNSSDGQRTILTKNGLFYSYTKGTNTWRWDNGAIVLYQWQRIGNTSWYYIQHDGSQSIGWTKISGNWYYFSEYGRMFWDEWISSGGNWYYVKTSGIMATNEWISSGGYWYHVDSDGVMQTGWYYDGSNWYYLRTATNTPASGPQGGMLANGSWYINGKTYHFNSSGVCTNP